MNDLSLMSDAHKDAYGFRPSADQMRHWAAMPPAEFEAAQDELFRNVERAIADENERQAASVVSFEAHIAKLMADHGIRREDAVRWDMDAYDVDPRDIGMYEYVHNLPYNYFKNGAA